MTGSHSLRPLALLLIAASLLGGCASRSNSIVGTWTATVTSPKTTQSLKLTEVYNADGSYKMTTEGADANIAMNGTYTAKDGVMDLHFVSGTVNGRAMSSQLANMVVKQTYKLNGNTLVVSDAKTPEMTLTRS